MKKIMFSLLLVIVAFFVLVGCQMPVAEEPAAAEEASPEEAEIAENLDYLEELDQLDEEFGSDISFEDLENLELE